MGWLDKIIDAPAKVAEAAAEGAARLPGVPLDVADAALKGADKGIGKLTEPKP